MKNSFMFTFALGSALAGAVLAALAVAFVLPFGPRDPAHPENHQTHYVAAATAFHDSIYSSTFYSEMAEVNARMHEDMAVTPTGDVNRDFVRMMIPHHQGAIDMALVILKHEPDERLRRLAQSIIVEQQQEITYMRLLDSNPPAAPLGSLPVANQ